MCYRYVKLGLFTVLGTTGNARVFPKESCTCLQVVLCYHIIAAKLSIGMDVICGKSGKVNLTVIRQNTKSKKEKMPGRKKSPNLEIMN